MKKQTVPFNDDAERIVLCSILIEGAIPEAIKGMLTSADFFSARHKAIYSAMLSLDGDPIDPVTIREAMQNLETWQDGCRSTLGNCLTLPVPARARGITPSS